MSRQTKRAYIIIGLILIPFVVGLLFTYEIIKVDFPTDMADSPAVDYQEGPRFLPPEGAVSLHGQPIVLDALPDNPVVADDVSLQRGEQLYGIHCALCHGENGYGDGPIAEFYEESPPPDIVGSNIGALFDGVIFRTITQGQNTMPALSENLTPRERWDVVNYLRTLEEG
ncbi:MAG: cytochrome c [Chloroflexi bacterium]|nr:cytochrome c [Chloroflexota bacterium]